ncbi:FAD-dependent oxidoreductase [Scrofimicrobium sp. R131]|uniref:FAD-dependent oxidoreductase n=1 Tax=Scrofimicrobium appendicitidis TaxID=3079930 RepID=A0AAU7V6K4_9ACTO
MAKVVVIGGGYGGITVAKGLDSVADVVLIEQRDQFVHHAAALRAAVDDVWGNAIFMPYSYLMQRGQVVHGTVSRVEGTTVHVFGQEPIEADYVVLATGSNYAFPAKHTDGSNKVAKARIEQLHESLQHADSALLLGAGTVGLELAGELAHAYPHMHIEIVEKEGEILPNPGYTAEFRHEIEEQIAKLDVKVHLNTRLAVRPPTAVGELGHFEVTTTSGDSIEADIWFQCYGSTTATGYLAGTEYQDLLTRDGTIQVEPTLQVVGHPHVYAVGDITNIDDSKRADVARQQARVAIANIANQIDGGTPDVMYESSKEWVVVPLGPNGGASQLLDSHGRTRIVGAEQTAEIKGADLMVSVIRSQLNLP